VSTLIGGLFWILWRAAGLLLLPLLWMLPQTRPHVQGVLAPEPGRTWLHGASAGENVAAQALAEQLSPRPWRTHTSMRTPVAGTLPAPLDLPFVFSRWLDRARPSRLILIESELWPGWLAACRHRGIPIAVVGSRESRGSRRWRWIPGLWSWLVRDVVFLSQSEIGDMKSRAPLPAAPFELERPAFIAASTRPGDEDRLLAAWHLLPAERPLLIIAPRHLERVEGVQSRVRAHELGGDLRSQEPDLSILDVLILDSMGELAGLFSQARAAFIGGSFDSKLGGHSPAEAFRAGLPVVAGPYQSSNPAAWSLGHVEAVPEDIQAPELAKAIQRAVERGPSVPESSADLAPVLARLPSGRTPQARPARPTLWPLVPLWRALSRRAIDSPEQLPIPVISVGALTAGGSGKTPVVAWLAEQLDDAWVVSRGYRRSKAGPEVRLGLPDQAPIHDLGDELEMLRRRGIPVVSSPDRVSGAKTALEHGARFILLDDSFQNRRLARDMDMVCIDHRWPLGRGPIPVGTARESWSGLRRASWLWVHHPAPIGLSLPALPDRPVTRSRVRPLRWRIRGEDVELSAVEGTVDVVVGIARPEGFLCTLLDLGLNLGSVQVLPDHGRMPALPPGCVVTEKDAARLPPSADIRVLITELDIEDPAPLMGALAQLEHR
jgi:tetraacyldisaccharide 4'-kinase